MSTTIDITRHGVTLAMNRIAEVCRTYDVTELAVFGSFLRDDFREGSDIDFLVRFAGDDYGPWMGKLHNLEKDLAALLSRRVEVVPRESVEQSENWIRRQHILGSAQVIYET
jgi:uncharacterized protein